MQQGELESAETHFLRGLRLLQRNLQQNSLKTSVRSWSSAPRVYSAPIFSDKVVIQSSDLVALFNRVLILSCETSTEASSDLTTLTVYSGVFMYNIALTVHILGLREGNAKRLTLALRLYSLAWQAFENRSCTQIELWVYWLARTISPTSTAIIIACRMQYFISDG